MRKEADLVTFTAKGYACENIICPNKTQAIKHGRFLKRYGYAFSYKVYQKNDEGVYTLIAKG